MSKYNAINTILHLCIINFTMDDLVYKVVLLSNPLAGNKDNRVRYSATMVMH